MKFNGGFKMKKMTEQNLINAFGGESHVEIEKYNNVTRFV
jgi:rubrerythrin